MTGWLATMILYYRLSCGMGMDHNMILFSEIYVCV